jgi:uncharacterized zinc-type alcohol dehydrogenase-like protein
MSELLSCRCYASQSAGALLAPWTIKRRDLLPSDVLIDIKYCGVCHSDIHQARDEWGGSIFPMVPGHEIVGVVTKVGAKVTRYQVGDTVGVGCFVDSCRECRSCRDGLEQYCERGFVGTYNSRELDGATPTYGGYARQIVVSEPYVLRIPKGLDLAAVAPLLCAGITTYSPLRHFGLKRGDRLGVVGLGGLGHMAVKFAKAMGAECCVFSTSPHKEKDARALGASDFFATKGTDESQWPRQLKPFDMILDTVSAPHNINSYLNLLKRDGTMVVVGVPPEDTRIHAFPLIMQRRRLAGSLIGGIKETQEMLDFCGEHHIVSEIEVIPASQINQAYDRVLKSDVKYRFVIDTATL